MMQRLSTYNVLEVAYLLNCNHMIVDIQPEFSWPTGVAQLAMIVEGEDLGKARERFLHGDQPDFEFLIICLRMIERALHQKQKAEFFPFWETWMEIARQTQEGQP